MITFAKRTKLEQQRYIKLHRNTTEAVVKALQLIFIEKKYADKVIERILKENKKWGARDRKFIAETTYDTVRWYRLLMTITGAKPTDFWTLMGAQLVLSHGNIPPWEEFRHVPGNLNQTKIAGLERKIKESIPDWLDQRGEHELGKNWDKELAALNQEAKVVLRVNTMLTTPKEVQEILQSERISSTLHPSYPFALILDERVNIFRSSVFKNGFIEVQDAASQLIAPFLQVEPGMRVIDACAGAGGKALHLASLMENKGTLLALDVESGKLQELKKRARRAQISNIETRLIDSRKVIKRLKGKADRLLLDVPCSGLGVLKRNPDAKWKLSESYIAQIQHTQQELLTEYSIMLKPGGLMVYATCSILPSENDFMIKNFVNTNPSFQLLEERHCWPSDGFDGFYMALLRKTE